MKKSNFIKATLILVVGGAITKVLGMFIKIVMTRMIGTAIIGKYMLIMPSFMLLISLTQFGFPVAISKLVGEKTRNNKKLVLSIIPMSLAINVLVILAVFLLAPILSNFLLKDSDLYLPILAIAFVLPFISISSIIRGYLFGKEKVFPQVLSNIIEDIVRLVVLMIGIPYFLKQGIVATITFLVLSNIISELVSIMILMIFVPKNSKIKKEDFKPIKSNVKDVLNISIPSTSTRFIGSISYFLEPIILTNTLLSLGYDKNFITTEYGVLNGYIIPLLLMPSFFTGAISQAIIPSISHNFVKKQYSIVKKKIKQALLFSFSIGFILTILFMLFPEFLLKNIYDTQLGINYLYFLAPVFILFYIQSPLTGSMQAMGKSKEAMKGTLHGTIIKLVILYVASSLKIGIWGLILAMSINIIYVTFHHLFYTIKFLKTK
ncbi:MAG: oligosaccharide flippase family protein [Bacilli bacterium]|nr:oligosaccharide flippase family protein [Bacilli bacterium]